MSLRILPCYAENMSITLNKRKGIAHQARQHSHSLGSWAHHHQKTAVLVNKQNKGAATPSAMILHTRYYAENISIHRKCNCVAKYRTQLANKF